MELFGLWWWVKPLFLTGLVIVVVLCIISEIIAHITNKDRVPKILVYTSLIPWAICIVSVVIWILTNIMILIWR